MSTQADMPPRSSSRRAGGTSKSPGATARAAEREVAAKAGVPEPTPRTGARRTVVDVIRQIPAYLRLLGGLLTDRRVSGLDKVLVAAAIVYILSPLDLLPDYLPFLGQVDDVYLLVLALQRLISNAGRRVLADYWAGPLESLSAPRLRRVLLAAAFFLPRPLRRRLRRLGRV